MVEFHMPKVKGKQTCLHVLDNSVATGKLDYLHHSKNSVPLTDQPGHVVCALAAAKKWNYDVVFLLIIITEFKRFRLPHMPKLYNTR